MRRKVGLLLVFGAVLPLAAASAAWACGVLATLTLNTTVATPGQAIIATGKNYSAPTTGGGAPTNASDVTIRLQSRTGRILTTSAPPAAGKLDKTFTLPSDISPGWYVVLATQFNSNGTPKSGTPGRTTLRVQGSSSAHAAAVSPWSGSGPSSPAALDASGSNGQPLLPMLLAGLLSLTMLAAGWALVSRRGRPASGPQLSV
jgi:hypothetical protein